MASNISSYTPVAQFSGIYSQDVDPIERYPWVYIIVLFSQKLLYIGESYSETGIVSRFSSHFGKISSLREAAYKNAGIRKINPPYLLMAAKLPFDNEEAGFNGESKIVRKMCEAILHDLVLQNFALPEKWTVISSYSSSDSNGNDDLKKACHQIYKCFESTYHYLESLSEKMPFNVVFLDRVTKKNDTSSDNIGDDIVDIEILLFDWVVKELKDAYGDSWWVSGVNDNIRIACATKQEEECIVNERVPKEAYLTLINLRQIITKNWKIFSSSMEEISGKKGKDAATAWIQDLNETRKLWAHPLKQRYIPIEPSTKNFIGNTRARLRSFINDA